LYYVLLHFWLKLGSGEFVIRALSALLGVGSLLVLYALACDLFDRRTALLSALLLAVSPLHIWFSQEARMYILVATLGLCSAYSMRLALRRVPETVVQKSTCGRAWPWVAYVLSTAMAINGHYFALFLLPFHNLYVLYLMARRQVHRGALGKWLLSQGAVGLLSLVGLAGVFSDESRYWWGLLDTLHGAPTPGDLLRLVFSFSLGTTVQSGILYAVGLLVFGSCAALSLLQIVPEAEGKRLRVGPRLQGKRLSLALDDGMVFTLLYLLVPLGTVFAYSQFRSSWVLRYLFPFLPPYCILLARGLLRLPGRFLGLSVTCALLLLTLWPLANTYRYQQKEDWRSTAQYIAAREQPGDVLLMVDEDTWLPFEHYYSGSLYHMGVSRTVTDRDFLWSRVGLATASYQRIWLVLSHTNNVLLKGILQQHPATRMVAEQHFLLVEVDLFAVRPGGLRPNGEVVPSGAGS
jgi:4-amino-4-deoxy-L-arabinose transferase-like glycosyltransferase